MNTNKFVGKLPLALSLKYMTYLYDVVRIPEPSSVCVGVGGGTGRYILQLFWPKTCQDPAFQWLFKFM